MSDELSLDEILDIQSQPEPQRSTRTKAEEGRSITTWFKVTKTKDRPCEVEQHDESRPRSKGMRTVINDVAVCRICYLAELDKHG